MLDVLDRFINNRLLKIKLKGASITVYPYMPDRDKGHTSYPCLAFRRFDEKPDTEKARSCAYVWDGETMKPYPRPIKLQYEVQVQTTDKTQSDLMFEMLLHAFPEGFQPEIDALTYKQYPLFIWADTGSFDDLSIPLFVRGITFSVSDVWVDSLDSVGIKVPTIQEIDSKFEMEIRI